MDDIDRILGGFRGETEPVIQAKPEWAQGASIAASFLRKSEGELNRTFFAPGTALYDVGHKEGKRLRLEWEEQATIGEAKEQVDAMMAREDRRDFTWPLSMLRVSEDGRMNGLAFDKTGWNGLLSNMPDFAGPGNNTVIAGNVNGWLPSCNKTRKFRTRNPSADGNQRDCFAVVSTKYASVDFDRAMSLLANALPKDAHAEYRYNPLTTAWSIDASFCNPIGLTEDTKVGVAHRLGVRLRGADNGTRKFDALNFAIRVSCRNHGLVLDDSVMLSRKHVGSLDSLVQEVVGNSGKALAIHTAAWAEANQRRLASYDGTPIGAEEAFKRIIAHGHCEIPGLDHKATLALLMDAWNAEPGDTLAHAQMAMTRAAQYTDSWETRNELEEQAGQLLYAKVYNFAPLSKAQTESFA